MSGHAPSEMDSLLAISRLLLSVTFFAAGFAKARRPPAFRYAMGALGLPTRSAPFLLVLIPALELATSFLLLWADTAVAGAAGALALLLSFIALMALNLARHQRAACGCFGNASGGPAGLAGLFRNQLLATLAGLVLWHASNPGPDVLVWMNAFPLPRRAVLFAVAALIGIAWGHPGIIPSLISRLRQPGPASPRNDAAETVPAAPAQPGQGLGSALVISMRPAELTIGMATYKDFDGLYFTLQALRLYQDLSNTELLVVDNYGCEHTRAFAEGWAGARYVLAREVVGTAAPRDMVFREAAGHAVLCCDSHVLFQPGVIARLRRYYRDHPESSDLLQGPLVYDDGHLVSTHMEPRWREQMWGTWATDPRGLDSEGDPFEIPMQGLGAFSCRRQAWLGFNPGFRGFGGEEGYIHEKFRQAGRQTLCLPWLRWIHRFGRPAGVPFPLRTEDKFRNYLIGHAELGLDHEPVVEHFSRYLQPEQVRLVLQDALGRQSKQLGVR
jgi:uncharacterized membrane protein YphA (DoxX/SURF4 family)